MSTIPSNSIPDAFSQADRVEVSQHGNLVKVGKKYFKVRAASGSVHMTAHELAKMAIDRLSTCSSKQLHATVDAKDTIKLQFSEAGLKICRMAASVEVPSKPLLELYEVPPPIKHTANYWVKVISKHLDAYSKATIAEAIESIFNESHLVLLDVVEGREQSEWGEKTIADLLQEPGNEELREGLQTLREQQPGEVSAKEHKKCLNDLKIMILKSIQRTPRVVPVGDGRMIMQQFVQGSKQLYDKVIHKKSITLEDIGARNRGYPSEADKGSYRNEIINNNTNLGTVALYDTDNTPQKVVVVRSGKSDTFPRVVEHVLEASVQQLSCKNPRGLVCIAPGRYEFQHAITSYLDPSRLKAIGEALVSGAGENTLLKKLQGAVDEWPEAGITVHLTDESNAQIEVTLKKPIIFSQLLSSTVRGVGTSSTRVATMGQSESDKINDKANYELLKFYPVDRPIKDFKNFLIEEMKGKNRELASAMYALLYRNDLHAADMEIMRNIALDRLNISSGKQCKSGTDRTAIGVALAIAQAKFEAIFGKTFDPTSDYQMHELLYFKSYFREALKEICISIVCETKGYSGIKWGGGVPFMGGVANPSAYKYLYLEEDIEQFAKLGVYTETADVMDLTYDDLKKGGASQYKGTLRDPRAFHGKSDKKHTEELAKTKKWLLETEDTRTEVLKEISSFFQQQLKIKDTQVVTDNLELAVHIRELELDKPIVEGAKITRAEILKAHIEELSQRERTAEVALELYALKQINTLWDFVRGVEVTVVKAAPITFTPPDSPRKD